MFEYTQRLLLFAVGLMDSTSRQPANDLILETEETRSFLNKSETEDRRRESYELLLWAMMCVRLWGGGVASCQEGLWILCFLYFLCFWFVPHSIRPLPPSSSSPLSSFSSSLPRFSSLSPRPTCSSFNRSPPQLFLLPLFPHLPLSVCLPSGCSGDRLQKPSPRQPMMVCGCRSILLGGGGM